MHGDKGEPGEKGETNNSSYEDVVEIKLAEDGMHLVIVVGDD